MSKRQQITLTLDTDLIRDMEQVREDTGMPISTQIELIIRGYVIVKKGKDGVHAELVKKEKS